MQRRQIIVAFAAASLGLSVAVPASAQRRLAGRASGPPSARTVRPPRTVTTPIEEFETLPREEQERALSRLPPAQRQKLEERLRRFNSLPPQQQQALKTLYNRLHALPSEQRETVRKAINRFAEAGPNRQQAMREELRNLTPMTSEERKSRLNDRGFKSQFSKKEQEILRDMSPLLSDRRQAPPTPAPG